MNDHSIPGILANMRKMNCRICEIGDKVFILEGNVLTIQNTVADHETRITSLEGNNAIAIFVVNTYANLPGAATVPGVFYYVLNSTGIPLINYHQDGLYYSDGVSWETSDLPLNAPQAVVDAGTDNTMYLTAETYTNSAQLAAKADKTFAIAMAIVLG